MHLVAPESWSAEAMRQVRAIQFEYTIISPDSLKAGQSGEYQLILTGMPDTIQVDGQTWQVQVQSELLLPRFRNLSEGMISQTVQRDTAMQFTWDVKAIDESSTTGILRSYVVYSTPRVLIEPQLLSVIELPLSSSKLLGMSITGINSLAIAILLITGLAGSLGLSQSRN
jgi:hypothetical protein